MEVTNNKEGKPLEYYLARYQAGVKGEFYIGLSLILL